MRVVKVCTLVIAVGTMTLAAAPSWAQRASECSARGLKAMELAAVCNGRSCRSKNLGAGSTQGVAQEQVLAGRARDYTFFYRIPQHTHTRSVVIIQKKVIARRGERDVSRTQGDVRYRRDRLADGCPNGRDYDAFPGGSDSDANPRYKRYNARDYDDFYRNGRSRNNSVNDDFNRRALARYENKGRCVTTLTRARRPQHLLYDRDRSFFAGSLVESARAILPLPRRALADGPGYSDVNVRVKNYRKPENAGACMRFKLRGQAEYARIELSDVEYQVRDVPRSERHKLPMWRVCFGTAERCSRFSDY